MFTWHRLYDNMQYIMCIFIGLFFVFVVFEYWHSVLAAVIYAKFVAILSHVISREVLECSYCIFTVYRPSKLFDLLNYYILAHPAQGALTVENRYHTLRFK